MLNRHGLKMNGIKKAAGETRHCQGIYGLLEATIYYWPDEDRVSTEIHTKGTQIIWAQDANVVTVAHTTEPLTMQRIADLVVARMMPGIPCFRNSYEINAYLEVI